MLDKKWGRASACLIAALALAGCLSGSILSQGGTPSTSFYAAMGDYLTIKNAAVVYAEALSTPAEDVDEILVLVEQGDARLAEIRALQHAGPVSPDTYLASAQLLRTLSAQLSTILLAEGVQ